MNDDTKLSPALKSRLQIINVPDYSKQEALIITRDFILPKSLQSIGLKQSDISIDDDACRNLLYKIQ